MSDTPPAVHNPTPLPAFMWRQNIILPLLLADLHLHQQQQGDQGPRPTMDFLAALRAVGCNTDNTGRGLPLEALSEGRYTKFRNMGRLGAEFVEATP